MRELMDQFLSGERPQRPPVLALAENLSSRLSSVSRTAMQADAGLWVASQRKAKQLLALDAMTVGADFNLLTEACSDNDLILDGELGQQVEALSRMCQTEHDHSACVAVSTGPATLASRLFGDSAKIADLKPIMTSLIEKLCEPRPDLLLLREATTLGQQALTMAERKAYNTLKNLASYYDVPIAIYLENYQPELLPELAKLKLPFLFLGCDCDGNYPDPEILAEISNDYQGLGIPINFDDSNQAMEQLQRYQDSLATSNYVLCSAGELDRDAELEALIELSVQLTA